jgi:DtxR family manganese transport transcriptional regulator
MMAKSRKRPASGRPPAERVNVYSRTRKDHQNERAEDYVELIEDLIEEKGEARAVDMARRLGVSHVTVTRTLARLQKGGWIRTEPYRAVFLTDSGRKLAADARRRHQVVLDFLIAAGVSRESATLDAEGIEHHVSPETLAAFETLTRRLRRGGS